PDCIGIPDCDDNNPDINPGAKEICGDGIDQDCDLTPDDGCPGVDCVDKDGDGFGVGSACVLSDCDDNNKDVYPWAPEKCGDNKDDNCNGIADDGCKGRQCVDEDADGYGVGPGCPGPQDCAPRNFAINPGAKEVCGDGLDNDCDNVADDGCNQPVDNDGDGAFVGGGVASGQPDCNDSDPNIAPGKPEICGDGIDNNCNGTIDDGCPGVDCKDNDGDGWGVGKDCAIQDCDDNDPKVHPYAKEECGDGKDNDCDGTVDDGCPGVDCVDKDGDGWGVGKGCAVSDCDDNDGGISPWAKEICGDGKDNDCDRSIDEGCTVCEDKDGDGHGIGPKCPSWDCDDNDKNTFAGADEICDGKDNNCDGVVPANESTCTPGGGADEQGCSCDVGEGNHTLPLALVLLLGLLFGLRARRRRTRA
ncbi:MAG: putative metal-binding motif-containing protein, partial [Myxococcales bacterium]|nr:putative metal-binding motif-containing protein [Myxococcales bacterium]